MRESKARHAQIKLILFMNFNHAGDHLQQSGHVTHRDIYSCVCIRFKQVGYIVNIKAPFSLSKWKSILEFPSFSPVLLFVSG